MKIMNIPAEISAENGRLIIKLPLTNPTGKIRVKRRSKTNYGIPIPTRKTSFTNEDYVEWQISYATQNPPETSKVEDIIINNEQIGFELTKLLYEGSILGILSTEDFNEMEKFIKDVQDKDTLEENEKIVRENKMQEIKGGFKKFEEKTPVFIKKNDEKGYFVEIILKHKQRAVGLQAMVHLCIYIEKLVDENGKSLIGRTATTREFGKIEINSENKELIKDVVKAFALASQVHKRDILSILRQVKEKCKLK
jgi:hypothetical protein